MGNDVDIGDERGNVCISPDQAIKLMALAEMVKAGDMALRADGICDERAARDLIVDVAQEIALQVRA